MRKNRHPQSDHAHTPDQRPAGKVPANSARARLHAERDRQAKRSKIRRRVTVAGSALTALALAAGVGVGVANSGGAGTGIAGADQPLKVPANTSGRDGTVITYGDKNEKDTLTIFEDPRCPFCAQFEQADGARVKQLADEGRFKVEYRFGTFLDDALGGQGSAQALGALGAAVNESPSKFIEYHKVLYANHPDENDDAFASTSRLLDLASKVDGLRTPAFDAAVKDHTYVPWASKVSDAFNKSGVSATPTVKLNNHDLKVIDGDGAISPQQFTALIDKGLKDS